MKRIPQIKNFMTPFPYAIGESAPLEEARAFMRAKRIRHLPVTRDGVPIGMITDRDVNHVLGPDFAYPNPGELTVGQVMLPTVYAIDLGEAVTLPAAHREVFADNADAKDLRRAGQ